MAKRLRTIVLAVAALVLAAVAVAVPSAATADVNDFRYSSWDARYELGIDDAGRASLRVTETVVAEFPETDQNRGIVRGLPEKYRGVPIFPTVVSVRDADGASVPYETDSEDDVLFIAIGDDSFQHGSTTYVIEYTMRDVVHRPDDADVDEFYWDLLPLDSTQPVDAFQATIQFSDALAGRLTGDRSCYRGGYGSRDTCEIAPDGAGGFRVGARDLPAGAGITVAFAMEPGTVEPSPASRPDAVTDVVPYAVAGGGALLVPVLGAVARGAVRRRHRAQGRGVVVAQYEVPAALPPLLAGELLGAASRATAAEIVHLGVHGALRIEEGGKKPTLTLQDPARIPDPLDGAALAALFPARVAGTRLDLAEPDNAVAGRLSRLPKAGRDAAERRGLIRRARSRTAVVIGIAGVLAGLVAIGLSVPGLVVQRDAAIAAFVISILLTAVLIVMAVVMSQRMSLLTPAGAEAWEHLQGAREYIRLAEADRIRMLQSYTGAERRRDGQADVIVLYERLLPYAMLFGMEKEWGRVLAVHYESEDAAPSWYTGYAIGSLGSSLSRMGSSLHATPVASSSSSSSGSFGGGFSGGGGGGGFSGGR
ncbi:DUF2207 domain-containing protein [Microbacterium resistens]|uniref:DUF2207 domain-containing protein n=1 Tax=Microbacterium resistens TaxID=156977 RepID=UPI00082F2EDF|nr:DUF2207 domain-containing protein [Microbacterium resistens]